MGFWLSIHQSMRLSLLIRIRTHTYLPDPAANRRVSKDAAQEGVHRGRRGRHTGGRPTVGQQLVVARQRGDEHCWRGAGLVQGLSFLFDVML